MSDAAGYAACARSLGAHGRAPAWTLTAAFGVAYVIVAPISSDLAAAGYRSELFSRAGLTLWDNGWYAGHDLLAYSLLAPAARRAARPAAAGGDRRRCSRRRCSRVLVAEDRFPRGAARAATLWFALGASAMLLANRIPSSSASRRRSARSSRRGRRRGAARLHPGAGGARRAPCSSLPAAAPEAPGPGGAGARAGGVERAREPAGGRVRRARCARVGDRRRGARARAGDRGGGARAGRTARADVPGRRHAAVCGVGVLPGARGGARARGAAAGARSVCCARARRCTRLRYARRVRDPVGDRR